MNSDNSPLSERIPAVNGRRWLARVSSTDERTMTLAELVDSWRTGMLSGDVLVRRAGSLEWRFLRTVPEARALLEGCASASQRSLMLQTALAVGASTARLRTAQGSPQAESCDFDAVLARVAPLSRDLEDTLRRYVAETPAGMATPSGELTEATG